MKLNKYCFSFLCCLYIHHRHFNSEFSFYIMQASNSPERLFCGVGWLTAPLLLCFFFFVKDVICLSNCYSIFNKIVLIWVTCWAPAVFQALGWVLATSLGQMSSWSLISQSVRGLTEQIYVENIDFFFLINYEVIHY